MPVYEVHLAGGVIREISAHHKTEDEKRITFHQEENPLENDAWFEVKYVRGVMLSQNDIPQSVKDKVMQDLLLSIRTAGMPREPKPLSPPSPQ